MKDLLENAYEEFVSIACGTWDNKVKRVLLNDLLDRLKGESVAFENLVYERMGMSTEDILDIIDAGEVLP